MAPRVALLTDYGPHSEHVGALHAVLAAGCPNADRLDLAHDLRPGDVRMGALVLARLAPLLPSAIFLAVVDPGVGGPRRAAAVALEGGGALVGPDNGLLGPAARGLGALAAVELYPPDDLPATFHGRDLFAPAAARLAAGTAFEELGVPFDPGSLLMPDLPPAEVGEGSLRALAVAVDHFGNLQLLAGADELEAAGFARGERIFATVGERRHPATVARVFADVAPKGLLLYLDSHGYLALAVNRGSAVQRLGAEPGVTVTLGRWTPD